MKKRKFFFGIITAAIAVCLALCVFMSACTVKIEIEANDDTSSGTTDGGGTSSGGSGDDSEDPEHTHSYDVLKYDDEYHWYECSCGEASPDTPVAHSSTKGYTYDDDSHWQVCDVCKQKFGMEAHDLTEGECVCGYKPAAHEHSYTQQNSDEYSHWYECPDDGVIDQNTVGAHDSAAYGSDDTYHWTECSVCGYKTGVETQHSSEGSEWITSSSSHWHTCVCGYKLDEASHTYGDDGTCTVCGYQKPTELDEITVYMVGDSTMCSFTDKIYIPRYGYGTQLGNYLNTKVTIVNLAISGKSSQTFLKESNYTTLQNSLQTGDYLIIGFGHNDEKSGDTFTSANLGLNESTEDTISFQDSLYDNYVSLAETKGATPILCTPIVRYSESGNYAASNGHVTADGDYPQAIRDLGSAKGIDVIDLTATTKADYGEIGADAVWYHSYGSAEKVEDGSDNPMARVIKDDSGNDVTVVPSNMDSTHLNKYGAKMVSYEFVTELAKTSNPLAEYINDDIVKPTVVADFGEDVYYADYVYSPYSPFDPDVDAVDTQWTGLPEGWYGTVFGDVGGTSYINPDHFTVAYDKAAETFTVGTAEVRGKISGSSDGLAAAFMQISVEENFTATAHVKVQSCSFTSSSSSPAQIGFGMMVRDDIYIDKYNTAVNANSATAGVIGFTTTYANYYRKDGSLKYDKSGTITPAGINANDEYDLTLKRENQTMYCTLTLSNNTVVESTVTDLNLYAVDTDYIYLCLFSTRGAVCEFSQFTYNIDGTAQGA